MKPLKIFVGLDNRFVLCEKFPNDEEHEGLHEMLDDLMEGLGAELLSPKLGEDYRIGYYTAYFSLNYMGSYYEDEPYLEIDQVEADE